MHTKIACLTKKAIDIFMITTGIGCLSLAGFIFWLSLHKAAIEEGGWYPLFLNLCMACCILAVVIGPIIILCKLFEALYNWADKNC